MKLSLLSQHAARWNLWLGRVLSVNTPMFTRYFLRGTASRLLSVKWATSDCCISQPCSWYVYRVYWKLCYVTGHAKQPILVFYSPCKCNCSNFILYQTPKESCKLLFAFYDKAYVLGSPISTSWNIIWELGPSSAFVVLGSHRSSRAQETILVVSLFSDTRHFPGR